jgi:DNA-binding XRE family transcriptional regulator
MAVSTCAISTADELLQSATTVAPIISAPSSNMRIGSRVRIKRTSRGMTQHDLSRLLGIERNKLVAYEAGEERVNANLLLRIAKLLGVRPHYFFQDSKKEDLTTI